MKRNGFTWWEIIAVVAPLLILAAIVLPVFSRTRQLGAKGGRGNCMNNLKQLCLGLSQYQADYQKQLPRVEVASTHHPHAFYGWADAIYPYIKNQNVYQCPTELNSHAATNASHAGYTDYWMNSNVSGLKIVEAKAPGKTIAFGDGNDGGDLTDAHYNLAALPGAWIDDKKSPIYRHIGGANYAFVDGHVRWLKPAQISNGSVTENQHTFLLR